MGCMTSQPLYISTASGNERDYQERYLESKTLGQGEFGVVKLVHDVKQKDLIGSKPLAVKYLKKGYQFKDNTLYSPIKKEVLQGEVEMLRMLKGECFTLKLVDVYESASQILMVTEYCEGGDMMEFVTNTFQGGLRTEDVSRISFQLWNAVDHCAKHNIIHRDIKPENVMFVSKERDAELRLIDFGSGTLNGKSGHQVDGDIDRNHTFAGSAFYISPEMFQRTYTAKTDVWSAGATLYVLVAGYPADRLQETFNILQNSKDTNGRLKKLPNLPDNLPESFHEMLEGSLVYRHKARYDAQKLLQCEFSQFHIVHEQIENGEKGSISFLEIAAEAAGENSDSVSQLSNLSRMQSTVLDGSVRRHSAYLNYQKFERSVTTILATILPREECKMLIKKLGEQNLAKEEDKKEDIEVTINNVISVKDTNASKLQIVTIHALVTVLRDMNGKEFTDAIEMMQKLQNYEFYENYAYHISLLRQFVSTQSKRSGGQKRRITKNKGNADDDDESTTSSLTRSGKSLVSSKSVHGNNVWNTLKSKKSLGNGVNGWDADLTTKSAGAMRRVNTATAALNML